MTPAPLPRLMVAPNGARRGKADHPRLPVSDDEVVACAHACRAAGANGIHAHIRDAEGRHLLDASRYRALIDRLEAELPDLYVQVTSEAAGRYEAAEQMAMVRALRPRHVSVAFRECVRQPADWEAAAEFYYWAEGAGVEIQHILYAPAETRAFLDAIEMGRIPGRRHLIQLVVGSYAGDPPDMAALDAHLALLDDASDCAFDWMLCAFGRQETEFLTRAVALGGKCRVGFENSLWNADGSLAQDNAERVAEVAAALAALPAA